jgi:hypothetical protein
MWLCACERHVENLAANIVKVDIDQALGRRAEFIFELRILVVEGIIETQLLLQPPRTLAPLILAI